MKIGYLTPNETELSLISGMPTDTLEQVDAACKALLSKGVKNVVATLGSRGAYACNGEGGRFIEGLQGQGG